MFDLTQASISWFSLFLSAVHISASLSVVSVGFNVGAGGLATINSSTVSVEVGYCQLIGLSHIYPSMTPT
jgi:hypothetical protein